MAKPPSFRLSILLVPDSDIRVYEVTFCSRVAGWANALFAAHLATMNLAARDICDEASYPSVRRQKGQLQC